MSIEPNSFEKHPLPLHSPKISAMRKELNLDAAKSHSRAKIRMGDVVKLSNQLKAATSSDVTSSLKHELLALGDLINKLT